MSGYLGNVLMGPECHSIVQLFTMVWSRDPTVGSMYDCLQVTVRRDEPNKGENRLASSTMGSFRHLPYHITDHCRRPSNGGLSYV